jgi:hypothetical protein
MEIIDLREADKEIYFQCLEEWSEEIQDAGDHKKARFACMKDRR